MDSIGSFLALFPGSPCGQTLFLYCKWQKAGRGLGTRLGSFLASFPGSPSDKIFQALYRYNNLTEDSVPIVGDLIILNCLVKLYLSNHSKLPSFLREFDYRICPTIGAIDVFISQISTLLHYSPIWKEEEEGGHNIVIGT